MEQEMEFPTEPEIEAAQDSWRNVRVILRHFRKDVRKRRRTLAGGAFFGFVYAAARVAEPWPLKVVFDQVLFAKPARGLIGSLFTPFGTSSYAILVAAGLALALIGVVRAFSYYYEDFMLSKAAQQIVYAIRTRLYAHLHRLPLSFHQERKTGDMLVRLSSDIILLRDVLVDAIVSLGTGVILIVMMVIVMALVDPVLTAVALAVMPGIFALAYFYGRQIRVNSQKQRKREGQVAAAMHEAISAMAVARIPQPRRADRLHQLSPRRLSPASAGLKDRAAGGKSVGCRRAGCRGA